MENDFDKILRILNEAFAADPAAIHSLLCVQVPCNKTLGDHPTVQVSPDKVGVAYTVGPLGIINGITEALTGRRICMVWKNAGQFVGFQEYDVCEHTVLREACCTDCLYPDEGLDDVDED